MIKLSSPIGRHLLSLNSTFELTSSDGLLYEVDLWWNSIDDRADGSSFLGLSLLLLIVRIIAMALFSVFECPSPFLF